MGYDELDDLIGLPVASQLRDVEARLRALLQGDMSPLAPATLRVAAAGGKRLRPALTAAVATIGDADRDALVNAAVAVELVQVGSLVHDDIFESAQTRRGTATINAVEGDKIALMAGDYILARAAQAAAGAGRDVAIALAVTIEELCIGQIEETTDLYDVTRTAESHLASIKRKTAVLYSCACRVGALCAGLGPEEIDRLAAFGELFGMAFQLLDDVFDLVSDETRLGKPVNIDITTGVYTLPVILALAGPQGERLRDLLEERDANGARELVLQARTAPLVVARAREYAEAAMREIASLPSARPLGGFPARYIEWALERFVVNRPAVA